MNKLNALLLLPCPLKVPLEREISEKLSVIEDKFGEKLQYKILSNAVAESDVFADIANADDISGLPDIIIAPGFSRFFYREFTERFRDTGCFEAVKCDDLSDAFTRYDIADPQGHYTILGFNPLVFLVDRTNEPELPVPRSWKDLTSPIYKKRVALRGKTDHNFCEGVLFTVSAHAGDDGIVSLAKNVLCRLHPSEMVKYAGSGLADAPAVSVIPYSFARLVKPKKGVEIVWPEEGAAVNPLVMLVKKDCAAIVKAAAEMLAGDSCAQSYEAAGFYSMRKLSGDIIPPGKKYHFIGWDYINSRDIRAELDRLNALMHATIHAEAAKQ